MVLSTRWTPGVQLILLVMSSCGPQARIHEPGDLQQVSADSRPRTVAFQHAFHLTFLTATTPPVRALAGPWQRASAWADDAHRLLSLAGWSGQLLGRPRVSLAAAAGHLSGRRDPLMLGYTYLGTVLSRFSAPSVCVVY